MLKKKDGSVNRSMFIINGSNGFLSVISFCRKEMRKCPQTASFKQPWCLGESCHVLKTDRISVLRKSSGLFFLLL